MPNERQSTARKGGGLKVLKEQSDEIECKTPNRPYLKATDHQQKTVYFIRPDCKLWSCAPCAQRRLRVWVHVARYGGDTLLGEGRDLSFVTLTSSKHIRSLERGIWVWRRAWPKLSARWRRAEKDLQYLYIPEAGAIGHFHVHLITTAQLPTRWYKDNAAETGLGYQAKAIPILQAKECGGYMGKYLGKALTAGNYPKYFRRVNCSRKWPRPESDETPYEWEMVGSKLSKIIFLVELALEEGWTVEHSLKELDWRR